MKTASASGCSDPTTVSVGNAARTPGGDDAAVRSAVLEPQKEERFMPPFPPWLPTPPYYEEWQQQRREQERLQQQERERRHLSSSEVASDSAREGSAAETAPGEGEGISLRFNMELERSHCVEEGSGESAESGFASCLASQRECIYSAAGDHVRHRRRHFQSVNLHSSTDFPREALFHIQAQHLRLSLASAEALRRVGLVCVLMLVMMLGTVLKSAVLENLFVSEGAMQISESESGLSSLTRVSHAAANWVQISALAFGVFFLCKAFSTLRREAVGAHCVAAALNAWEGASGAGLPSVCNVFSLPSVLPVEEAEEVKVLKRQRSPSTEEGRTEGSSDALSSLDGVQKNASSESPSHSANATCAGVSSLGSPDFKSKAASLLPRDLFSAKALCEGLFPCAEKSVRRDSADSEVLSAKRGAVLSSEKEEESVSKKGRWSDQASSSVSWSSDWRSSDEMAENHPSEILRARGEVHQEKEEEEGRAVSPGKSFSWKLHRHSTIRQAPPPLSVWPQRPIYLRAIVEPWIQNQLRKQRRLSLKTPLRYRLPMPPLHFLSAHLPASHAVHSFETPFFRGKFLMVCADCNGLDSCGYGSGNATSRTIVQGRFLQPWRIGEVVAGQIYERPLKNMPHPWLVGIGMKMMSLMTNVLKEDITSQTEPYLLSPLVCIAEKIHVASSPKDAPSLETLNIPEDTRLLFGGEVSLTDKSRKGILINRSKMSSIRFDPNYIYTFDLMQNIFIPATYEYDVKVSKISTVPIVESQAVEVMALIDPIFIGEDPEGQHSPAAKTLMDQNAPWLCRPKEGERRYLWRMQIWHEKQLPYLRKNGQNTK